MSIELRIKAKHLALEPAIIRHEERKLKAAAARARAKGNTEASDTLLDRLTQLNLHRINDVRREARATHLARAYLRGRSYNSVEEKTLNVSELEWLLKTRVAAMVRKYGKRIGNMTEAQIAEDLKAWAGLSENITSAT